MLEMEEAGAVRYVIAGPDKQNGYRNCIDPNCGFAHSMCVDIAGEQFGVCEQSWPMVKRILDLLDSPGVPQ